MENSSFKKQAKSDIFKELFPVINFYIRKGAKPQSLKKFYKNNKRFNDLLDDIKNKGINLIKDEQEYKKLVREILNDILDDFIAKCKDEDYKKNKESKMKHIKEFYTFEMNEELSTLANWGLGIATGVCIYKFLKGLASDILDRNTEKIINSVIQWDLKILARKVGEHLEKGEKILFSEDFRYYKFTIGDLIILIDKQKNILLYSNPDGKISHNIKITKEEIEELKNSLKEENNE